MNESVQVFTASIQQNRLWKLGPDTLQELYVEATYTLPPALNQESLNKRLELLLRKHEILRSSICEEDGRICQVIGEKSNFFTVNADFSRREIVLRASPLVADKRTLSLIASQLFSQPGVTDDAPMQFADYAAWQEELLSSAAESEGATYWKQKAVVTPALQLRTKTASHKFRLGKVLRIIPTPAPVTASECLALWAVLAARHCGASEISIATADNRRKLPELENAAGPYAAWLPVTFDLKKDDQWQSLAATAEIQRKGNETYSQYFEAIEDPHCKIAFEETEENLSGITAPFDLCLSIQLRKNQVAATIYYNSAAYFEEDAVRILSRYANLLKSAGNIPLVKDLPLLTPEERSVLTSFNSPDQPGKPTCIHYLIENQARQTPNRVAVSSSGTSYTYQELNKLANGLAHQLLNRGLKTETPIGICLGRSAETVVSILAVLKAGCAYVPLDPAYPKDRIERMIEQASIPVVITSRTHVSALPPGQQVLLIEEALSAPGKVENPPHLLGGEELAYIIFTSGSTGQPKGVLIQHNTLVTSTQARLAYYKQQVGSYLMVSSFSFDSSVAGIFWTLISGGTLVVPKDENHNDPFALKRLIQSEAVTHLLALPSLYNAILDSDPKELRTLRTVIVAGEACTTNLVEKHFSKLPHCALYNEYGPTEGTVWATAEACAPGKPITIGKPIPNTQAYILDSDLQLTPLGLPGELCIGGAGIARGYLNQPELESKKFIPDPFIQAPSRRLYRTGDFVRFTDSGEIEFLGRVDNQVKIRGHRIELEEIELALCSLPGVNEAVVLPQQNADGVYVDIIAFVLGSTTGEHCRAQAARTLPDYMAPSRIIVLQTFPRTTNGKVDRKALSELKTPTAVESTTSSLPKSPVEERVFDIWKDVLGRDGFGVEDSFFHLGGHSLLAIQMMGRIKEEFEVELPLKVIFEKSTITGIADSILELLLQEEVELEGVLEDSPQTQNRVSPNGLEALKP